VIGALKRVGLALGAAAIFARLYVLPVHHHELPDLVRAEPVW